METLNNLLNDEDKNLIQKKKSLKKIQMNLRKYINLI